MTSAKLKGNYDDIDVDDLLEQLSPEELEMLAKEVDPDVSYAPFIIIASIHHLHYSLQHTETLDTIMLAVLN